MGYFVPGIGRSSTADWKVDGAHMAERCALFVIIALGESILVTGATAASQPATTAATCAFLVAFLGTVAMWWIYFNIGAERGSREIAGSADPGRYARAVYTYFHIPDRRRHRGVRRGRRDHHRAPGRAHGTARGIALLGGPALYLAGNVFFKRASAKYYPLSHLVGLGLLRDRAVRAVDDAAGTGHRDDGGTDHGRRLGDPLVCERRERIAEEHST